MKVSGKVALIVMVDGISVNRLFLVNSGESPSLEFVVDCSGVCWPPLSVRSVPDSSDVDDAVNIRTTEKVSTND